MSSEQTGGYLYKVVVRATARGLSEMSKNQLFLHRSEHYIYYFRRAIPNELREAFNGMREIKKSLKTRNRSTAILRHQQVNVAVEQIFDVAREGKSMANQDLAKLIKTLQDKKEGHAEREHKPRRPLWSGIVCYFRGQPLLDSDRRVIMPTPVRFNGAALEVDGGELVLSFDVTFALQMADQQGIPVIDEKAEKAFTSGFAFYFDAGDKGLELVPLDEFDPSQLGKPQPRQKPRAANDYSDLHLQQVRFSDMVGQFLNAKSGWSEKTRKAYAHTYDTFIQLCGDPVSTQMTHTTFNDFADKIARLPSNAKKVAAYRDKSLAELAAMEVPAKQRVSVANANKHISRVSQLCKWAEGRGFMARNFAEGKLTRLSGKQKKKGQNYSAFTHDELVRFFSGPIHQDNKREGKDLEMFWLPLVALYSGMRLEEIAQLQTSDVHQIEDRDTGEMVWVFNVNESGYNKSVKNNTSTRRVAIHSELVKMGLMEHYRQRLADGKRTLWNLECVFGKDGERLGYGQNIGKRLRNYINRKVGLTQKDKVFHSFRHTVIDVLRNSHRVREDYLQALVGHALQGTTGKDYFGGLGASVLKETVEAIQYPRLDLSPLHVDD